MRPENGLRFFITCVALGGFGIVQTLRPIEWAPAAVLALLAAYVLGPLVLRAVELSIQARASRPVTSERVPVKVAKPAREAFSVSTRRASAGRRVV